MQFARQGVRVNALCPGPVETPLLLRIWSETPGAAERRLVHVPMGRMAKPREIVNAALFLASDESSYVNAATFVVDGGLTAAYVTPGIGVTRRLSGDVRTELAAADIVLGASGRRHRLSLQTGRLEPARDEGVTELAQLRFGWSPCLTRGRRLRHASVMHADTARSVRRRGRGASSDCRAARARNAKRSRAGSYSLPTTWTSQRRSRSRSSSMKRTRCHVPSCELAVAHGHRLAGGARAASPCSASGRCPAPCPRGRCSRCAGRSRRARSSSRSARAGAAARRSPRGSRSRTRSPARSRSCAASRRRRCPRAIAALADGRPAPRR